MHMHMVNRQWLIAVDALPAGGALWGREAERAGAGAGERGPGRVPGAQVHLHGPQLQRRPSTPSSSTASSIGVSGGGPRCCDAR
jgi:hypothetical protein